MALASILGQASADISSIRYHDITISGKLMQDNFRMFTHHTELEVKDTPLTLVDQQEEKMGHWMQKKAREQYAALWPFTLFSTNKGMDFSMLFKGKT